MLPCQVSLAGDAAADQGGVVAVIVPGGLSSGKTTAIDELKRLLQLAGVRVASTLDLHNGADEQRGVQVFEHHPDSVAYMTGHFDGAASGRATSHDRRWVERHRPRFVLMNCNATDGAYVGAETTRTVVGTLGAADAMTRDEWKDFVLFTLHNALRRDGGFRPDGKKTRTLWFKVAKQKCASMPSRHHGLWSDAARATETQVRDGWQRHSDRGNDVASVHERMRKFVDGVMLPALNDGR
jgi:hypothetical protein